MIYHNYHKHDTYGNPWSQDVIVKPDEYCQRAVELGHTTVFTTNHGVQGNIFAWIECAKKYGLKMCYGAETYFVNDRFEKDRSNKHLIVIAKNNDGAMQLNEIMSEAHSTGFYYKPRIDKKLLFSLNPRDVIITSACVAGIWDDPELIVALHNRFKDNFFLEMQAHNIEIQKKVNQTLLDFSQEVGIPIIHANDSHYIYPKDKKYRDIYLNAKNMHYQDEGDMILDYPDSETIFERYHRQGILNNSEVKTLLDNTLVFDECEPITLINDDIKLPPVSDNPKEELRKIIYQQWDKDKQEIPKEKWDTYVDSIEYELDIIDRTNMENYFLIDYKVVKDGQEKYGGKLTNTGRGSAPSFFTTKMLGLTNIDRISAPITLFPTRFMSVERILGARSLPDIDLNTADREPFIKATEDLLGKENCAWMIAWKPLQDASAFRMYCKGINMHISEYDEVAKNLDDYREDKKWKPIIEESKRFIGVIESVSESPCSMLLYNKPVNKELGLIRTSKGKICCLLDGYNCDKYKYLKNDYLTVIVWAIIRDVCKLANIKIPTIRELEELLDDKTYDIYKNGVTCTINQVDSDWATGLVKTFRPQSVAEMSAFVAIIRPGCASLLQGFINRKDYTTGVPELDKLLEEGKSRMIYQELIMKYLIWLGIPETGSYDIIKKIAKKKFKEPELAELKEKLLNGWIKEVGTEKGFIETWTVVEQASKYSFNASHSLSYAYDSLYGAYLKSHYPLEYYTVALSYYSGDAERTARLTKELEYFGIKMKPIKFRYSTAKYNLSKADNAIYKGVESIKDLNQQVGDELYSLKENNYRSFLELLIDMKEKTSIKKNQILILIELDYFSEFGDINKLKKELEIFLEFYDMTEKRFKKQFGKEKIESLNLHIESIRKYSARETKTMFTQVNCYAWLIEEFENISIEPTTIYDKARYQLNRLDDIYITDEKAVGLAVVKDVDTKYAPRLKMYSLKNGTTLDCKISKKDFKTNKLQKGDITLIISTAYRYKKKKNENDEWVETNERELWINKYFIVSHADGD